jgi:hypothetical protein
VRPPHISKVYNSYQGKYRDMSETPIHLVVGMVLDGVADADERQRVGEHIKQLEARVRELSAYLDRTLNEVDVTGTMDRSRLAAARKVLFRE